MHKLKWFEGAPAELKPGMIVQVGDPVNRCLLVGHTDANGKSTLSDPDKGGVVDPSNCEYIKRWSWLIKPFELDWLEAMSPKVSK